MIGIISLFSLIKPVYFQFVKALMKFWQGTGSEKIIYKNRQEWTEVELTNLRVDEDLTSEFWDEVLVLNIYIDSKLLCAIYKQIGEYVISV